MSRDASHRSSGPLQMAEALKPPVGRSISISVSTGTKQEGTMEHADKKRNNVNTRRFPSQLTPELRALIVESVRQGRSVTQVAKEFQVSTCVVSELWTRRLEQVFAELRRKVAA